MLVWMNGVEAYNSRAAQHRRRRSDPQELLDGNRSEARHQFGFGVEPVFLRRTAGKAARLGAKVSRPRDHLPPFSRVQCRRGIFVGDGSPGPRRSSVRRLGHRCGRCFAEASAGFSGLDTCHELFPFWQSCAWANPAPAAHCELTCSVSRNAKSGPTGKSPTKTSATQYPPCFPRCRIRNRPTGERWPCTHPDQKFRLAHRDCARSPGVRTTRRG